VSIANRRITKTKERDRALLLFFKLVRGGRQGEQGNVNASQYWKSKLSNNKRRKEGASLQAGKKRKIN